LLDELVVVLEPPPGTKTKYAATPAMIMMTTTIATVADVEIALRESELIFILSAKRA
jgi:hypothetical protein